MKTKITIAAIMIFSFAFSAFAQSDADYIKVLPAANKNMIKVLYADKIDAPVTVTFFTSRGYVTADKITRKFDNGVMKTYDVSRINKREYWVEITSENVSARYHITPSEDNKTFVARLEKSSPADSVVASNN